MGTGFHGGFGNTNGYKEAQTIQLISELEALGVKFTKEDIVFITKDKTGQVIWLEKGNSSSGLEHIISRHEEDFQAKHNLTKSDLPSHLEKVFTSWTIEYTRTVKNNGGFERLYSYNGRYYLLSGIGQNGYIVSAYPIGEEEAQYLIWRYKE